MGVPITGTLTTYAGGVYPTHNDQLGWGGCRVVADHTARNAIATNSSRLGMLVITQADAAGIVWQLTTYPPTGADGDWTQLPSGGGGTPGGTSGQIQYNAAGSFGGFTFSGDFTVDTSTGIGTLATVNASPGTGGGSTAIPVLTLDAKGRVTAATTAVVVAPAGTLSGTTLNATVVTSSLTSVGVIASGTWQGTAVATAYLGATLRPFTAILGQGVPVAVLTNAAGDYIICSNAGTFARWDLAAVTAPVGASLVIDCLKSSDHGSTWATLWSTTANRPTLTTTVNNASGTAFDVTTFSAGDWLRFDVITVGSSTAGQNITLVILGHMNQ